MNIFSAKYPLTKCFKKREILLELLFGMPLKLLDIGRIHDCRWDLKVSNQLLDFKTLNDRKSDF